ncbi:MAG: methionine biosynthesis protein MetW [Rhodocyclaceae bacterium]|nr:methionine biosynthesis protein MetW [Rhodocyclaceae bacterium]
MTHAPERFDFDVIAGWIRPGERVLDLGCGDGSLLRHLRDTRQVLGYGVELSPANVLACVKMGINVLQSDLERGLSGFESGGFDHVIMSLSLQAVHNTERLLREMLRVGREAAVSFPNFGYHSHRAAIAAGRMPVSKALPYRWYDSPNVRFFTIADFEDLCAAMKISILECHAFDESAMRVRDNPNLNASIALYRLGRTAPAA